MNTFGDRVRKRREELGMSQEGLGKAAGISQSTIAQIERGRNQGTKHMLSLARALDVDAEWLETGRDAKQISAKTDASDIDPKRDLMKRLLPADKGNVIVWERPEDLEPDEDRVWIDRYDYRFSAGEGLIQWEVRQKKALPFDIGFFKALGVRPQDCRLAQVHGRSMEPYLFHRDMMMICSAKTQIRDGLIYAVYFEDEQLVKQIFKEPNGALRLHSYNAEFPDRILAGEQLEALHVAGEVVYRSGSGLAGGN
ncbi:MAG: S24 family peptidase [Paraburkholderia tropica]|nr:S24 family peptidase [Paraburkholderia tropica]